MNFILMQFGYPPVIIRTEDKANYFSALQLADSGLIESFIDYIAKNLVRSLELMIAGATGQSIEEPDDLDKEIALLEQKFKAVGSKIEITRTKEAILDIYDNSIVRLWEQFVLTCKMFEGFYVRNEATIYMLGAAWDGVNASEMIRKRLNESSDFVHLLYDFTTLNREGTTDYNYRSQIECQFCLTKYIVKLSNKLKTIEKSYGEQLMEDEINELVKSEARRHKDFIESKLKEIQDKDS